jgi:hypothetical protein|tara:strand:- start:4800 stop:5480 length:681 start_codon:yes stop_codon:yes gene_type:complete
MEKEKTKPKIKLPKFDSVGISKGYKDKLGGKKIFSASHITNSKPDSEEWFQIFAPFKEMKDGLLVKMKIKNKKYDFVVLSTSEDPEDVADFEQQVKNDFRKVKQVYFAYYVTTAGRCGIWPVTKPDDAGLHVSNRWVSTAYQVCEKAHGLWVKLIPDTEEQHYQGQVADDQTGFGKPDFRLSYEEVFFKAYEDFILTEETYTTNKYVKEAVGKAIHLVVPEKKGDN